MDVGTVVVEHDDGVWVLTPRGEHDIAVTPSLRDELERVFDSGSTVVVDLSEVDFIDSSVLSGLMYGQRRAEREDHRLAIVMPTRQGSVSRLLDMAGVSGLFATYASRAQAVGAVRAGVPS